MKNRKSTTVGGHPALLLILCIPSLLFADSPPGRFSASEGVVTDTVTGLAWQQAASPTDLDWGGATDYCESLALFGGGWRLPSMKEIQTLVVETQTNPAVDSAFFSDGAGERFWTSSRPSGLTDRAWLFDSTIGQVYTQETFFNVRARCVR